MQHYCDDRIRNTYRKQGKPAKGKKKVKRKVLLQRKDVNVQVQKKNWRF